MLVAAFVGAPAAVDDGAQRVEAQRAAGTYAFMNVTVVPMDSDRTIPDQTVLVRDGRIISLAPSASAMIPAGAERIDGRGKYLMPGFTEMHGHVPSQRSAFAENVLALYALAGVTTVRGMQGAPAQLEMRRAVMSGELLGPTLVLSGPAMSGGNTPTPAAGARKVRDFHAAGFDLLKIHEGLSPATYDSIVAVAKALRMPFGGHVPDDVGVKRALEAGQGTIDHLDNYVESIGTTEFAGAGPDAQMREMVAATRAANAAVVPTMALWEAVVGHAAPDTMGTRPELRYVPPQMVTQWTAQLNNRRTQANRAEVAELVQRRNRLLAMMRDGGVRILFGTDAPQMFSVPGFSVRREMTSMVAAGLTPWEIMRSGTSAVAEHFGAAGDFGTVAVGRRADLVLLDGNPLESVGNFSKQAGVMVRGQWLPRSEIERRLAAISASYSH